MSTHGALSESPRGYLSEDAKRRFTLTAGILGALFFIAQMVLPMLVMFAVFFPTMALSEFHNRSLESLVAWKGDLWFVEETFVLAKQGGKDHESRRALRHVRLTDLEDVEGEVPLDWKGISDPTLLPQPDRLWLIGGQQVMLYDGREAKTVAEEGPSYGTRPFLLKGQPAYIDTAHPRALVTLQESAGTWAWVREPITLEIPTGDDGLVSRIEALNVGERIYVVADVEARTSRTHSLHFRELGETAWSVLGAAVDCDAWSPVDDNGRLAVVVQKADNDGRQTRASLLTVSPGGAVTTTELKPTGRLARRFSAIPGGQGFLLVREGIPGGWRLTEIANGTVVREVRRKGSGFPFPVENMMFLMTIPQLMPIALSLLLALILTWQMRRYRVARYMAQDGREVVFATIWQRAVAQVVDGIILGAGFVVAMGYFWRFFTDMEPLIESSGPTFPLVFFGLFALAFLWGIGVLIVFSYFEGRSGRTPGKRLMGIRVLGTDLAPCGFGRAVVRNLLTFADGFFNFLVGILLVALTENWQRLGDLAARTLVVQDERPAA